MDELAVLATMGEPDGTVVLADEQTAGRGRRGNSWHATAGRNILCSVLLRPSVSPASLPTLPLVAGVAVAGAIEQASGDRCQLKWPNDVWLAGKKVAGVLMTARVEAHVVRHVIIGIGINVNEAVEALPPGAISLRSHTGHVWRQEPLLRRVLDRLDHEYRAFLAGDGQSALAAWRSRAAMLDEAVSVLTGDARQDGILRGVADDGALMLEVSGEVMAIYAGEVQRGPRLAGSRERSVSTAG